MNHKPQAPLVRVGMLAIDVENCFGPRLIIQVKDPEDEAREHRELWLKLQRLEALYPWPRKAAVKLRLPTGKGVIGA